MKSKTILSAGSIALFLLCSVLFAQEPPEPGSSKDLRDEGKHQEEATLFPIPDYSGDFFSREALTGDWGGARTAMAEKGIQFAVDLNQYYQGITSGGFDERWEYNGTTDYRLRFDSGKSGLWPGGFIEVHGESYWGESVINFSGSILPVNMDLAMSLPAGQGTYLSHVVFTQFLSERFAITMGKLDTSSGDANEYAHGVGDRNFMNAGFQLNPVTYLTSPYSTLGGGFIYLAGSEKQHMLSVMVYDGDGRIDESGFDTIGHDNTTYAVATRLETNFFGKKGHQWFGFLYGDGSFSGQTQDPRILLPEFDPGIIREDEDSTWAFFYNFDQQLVSDPNNPERDWGVFGRIGVADNDTSVIESFWSIGLGGKGLFPSRSRDRFGVGYYYMVFADERVELILPEDDEQGMEVFYNMAVTPWFELSADLQWLDGALNNADTAVIAGIRGRIEF